MRRIIGLCIYFLITISLMIGSFDNGNQVLNNIVIQSKIVFPAFIVWVCSSLKSDVKERIRDGSYLNTTKRHIKQITIALLQFILVYMLIDNIMFAIQSLSYPNIIVNPLPYLLYIIMICLVLVFFGLIELVIIDLSEKDFLGIIIPLATSFTLYIIDINYPLPFSIYANIWSFSSFVNTFSISTYIVQIVIFLMMYAVLIIVDSIIIERKDYL